MKKLSLALVALLSVAIFSCKSGDGDPKTVLGNFFGALEKKDIAKAKTYATKESEQMLGFMEMALTMAKDSAKLNEFDKYKAANMELGEPKIEGDKATISVKEKTTGEAMDYTLKKENGQWKVAFDKNTVMSMGMQKLKEGGVNVDNALDSASSELKKVNLDSMSGEIKEGLKKATDTAAH